MLIKLCEIRDEHVHIQLEISEINFKNSISSESSPPHRNRVGRLLETKTEVSQWKNKDTTEITARNVMAYKHARSLLLVLEIREGEWIGILEETCFYGWIKDKS